MPHDDKRLTDERTIPIREEELKPRKERTEAGRVGIDKEVVTERQTKDVPLRHEEVEVDYRPVDRRPSDRPISEGESIDVPVHEEKVSGVDKETVVTGEIGVSKRQAQRTKPVSGTVRREEPRIEKQGDLKVRKRS